MSLTVSPIKYNHNDKRKGEIKNKRRNRSGRCGTYLIRSGGSHGKRKTWKGEIKN